MLHIFKMANVIMINKRPYVVVCTDLCPDQLQGNAPN